MKETLHLLMYFAEVFDHYYYYFSSFAYSPGPNAFQVTIKPTSGRGRIWTQVLDRNDGTFLVRYRLFQTYPEMRIDVMSGDRHVGQSPFIVTGNF